MFLLLKINQESLNFMICESKSVSLSNFCLHYITFCLLYIFISIFIFNEIHSFFTCNFFILFKYANDLINVLINFIISF